MNIEMIVGTLCENATWMEHPHDATRHYSGRNNIAAVLEKEFQNKQDSKMIFFPDTIIFDKNSGVAHVEWLQSVTDTSSKGNVRERHSSHSVLLKFRGDKIERIRFHSIKTNKYWTQGLVMDPKNTTKRRTKKKKHNGKNGNDKNGSRGRRNGRRNKKRNGKNGHRGGSNGRARSRDLNGQNGNNDYELHNVSEQKPVAEEIENPKPVENKSSSANRKRGRNGRTSGQSRGRYRRRGGQGRGRRRKKEWIPWTCSNCSFHNTAESTSCKNCDKKFDFKEDLSESLTKKLTNSTEEDKKQETPPAQVLRDTESNV